jgi:hypothetical protein
MGTTCESAKGIVFIASDKATCMAGSAVARQQRLQRLQELRLRSAYSRATPTEVDPIGWTGIVMT